MRYKNLIGFVWVAVFMSLFTSCLKDINNVYNPGTTAAVVRQHGDSALMMANTRFGWIYSTKLSSYSEGKCLLVSFDYDPSLPENTNAEQKGYYTVTIQGETAVNQQNAESPLTDTHKLLTNEQPVLAVNPNDSVLYIELEDYLFLPSACWTTKDRTLNWQLTYDPAQEAVVENRKSIYSLYLRAAATTGKPEDKAEEAIGSRRCTIPEVPLNSTPLHDTSYAWRQMYDLAEQSHPQTHHQDVKERCPSESDLS